MSTVFRICDDEVRIPDWYPPPAPDRPTEYPLRAVELDMLITAMMGFRVVAMSEADVDLIPPDAFTTVGSHILPEQCVLISRSLRRVATEDLHPNYVLSLRSRWNEFQAQLKEHATRRGETIIAGLEPFPHDSRSLRNALLHWGAFNGIASEHGGYRVIS